MTVTAERVALRMLNEGHSLGQITAATGLDQPAVRHLAASENSRQQLLRLSRPCTTSDRCGKAQDGPGRPRKGWVQVKPPAQAALWFCGWTCAGRYARRQELQQTDGAAQ